jgi:hypothetical protein
MIALLAIAGGVHADPASPRVRPLDAWTASLLARGCRESPTFAALVTALERSDVIAHVGENGRDPGRSVGETRFVVRLGGVRYLRISIQADLSDEAAIGLTGHELHHAWEIAQARWVVDAAAVLQLYVQIGHIHDHDGALRADSSGARRAGAKIFAEVLGHTTASD